MANAATRQHHGIGFADHIKGGDPLDPNNGMCR